MPYLGDPDLVNWIIAANPLVLVIDPLQAFLPNTANMNNRQQMRRVLQDLRMLAQQRGFAILLVTHTNKNPSAFGRKRLNGSGELWDTARSVLIMGHTRDGSKSYVSHEKSSYGVPADTILCLGTPGLWSADDPLIFPAKQGLALPFRRLGIVIALLAEFQIF